MDNDRGTRSASDNKAAEDDTATEKSGGRGCGCWILLILLLLGGGGATMGLVTMIALRQETPLPGEAEITDLGVRLIMVPSEYADMRIPRNIRDNRDAAVAAGRELYEVECAMCHGMTGKGDAPMGMVMFPAAANLSSQRTQTKSDGQLWWLTAHGMNYTGMPAWHQDYGGPNDTTEIWNMVAYIRSLATNEE